MASNSRGFLKRIKQDNTFKVFGTVPSTNELYKYLISIALLENGTTLKHP